MNNKLVFSLLLFLVLMPPNIVVASFFTNLKMSTVDSENTNIEPRGNGVNLEPSRVSRDLTSKARQIIIGEVMNVESRWDKAENVIYSYAQISVENRLKGDSTNDRIIVKYKGGEVGNIGLRDSAEPSFERGERVKVFLKSLEKTGNFAVVDGKQGKVSLSSSASSGYGYNGYHWNASDLPVKFYINENGTPDIAGTAEFAAVQSSFQTWEDDNGSYMDYTYMGTTTRNGSSLDGFNAVSWQPIDGPGGTLAETSYWYDVTTKQLSEFDIVFDEDETWSVSGEVGKYDVQNVGTHEVGHTLVLNDLYDLADSEETMYGYSLPAETKKRDLYTGDVAGIRFIYGLSAITYTIDTNPAGLQIDVDGVNYTTPYSFSWTSGSQHVITAISPQNQGGGTRYVFEKWNDGGAQSHSVSVGTSDASLTADYSLQYLISIKFKTDDNAQEIYPTQIQIFGAPPNSSVLTLRSFSNVWLDDVQWTIKEIRWQGNNIVPSNNPTQLSPSANLEWVVKSRVYPTRFNQSFKDSKGSTLPTNPSSFQLRFPNGTTSNHLDPSDLYYIQNGTTTWYSIRWQNTEVAPINTVFDATDGNPTVNCLVYSLIIRVTDILGLPVSGASISVTLSNGTTVCSSTGIQGSAVFKTIPQGKFTATTSYIGQTTTVTGDVANAAANPIEEKITFSLPVLLLIFVPVISACLLILVIVKRRSATVPLVPSQV